MKLRWRKINYLRVSSFFRCSNFPLCVSSIILTKWQNSLLWSQHLQCSKRSFHKIIIWPLVVNIFRTNDHNIFLLPVFVDFFFNSCLLPASYIHYVQCIIYNVLFIASMLVLSMRGGGLGLLLIPICCRPVFGVVWCNHAALYIHKTICCYYLL